MDSKRSSTVSVIVLTLVFPVVFNVIFFMKVSEYTANTWVSYAIVHLAYLFFVILTICTVSSDKDHSLKRVPIFCSAIYFLAVFVAEMVFICSEEVSEDHIIFQVCLFGIITLIVSGLSIADNHTMRNLKKHQEDMVFIHESEVVLNDILILELDSATEKDIRGIYDMIHNAPTYSYDEVKGIEEEILLSLTSLKERINEMDREQIEGETKKIKDNIGRRNMRLRMKHRESM